MTTDRTTEIDLTTASAARPRVRIADDLDVDLVPYLEFCGRVLRAGIAHVRQHRWATTAETLDAVLPHAVSTSRWHRYETALLDLGGVFGSDCLVYVWLGKGDLSIRVAAHDLPALAEAEAWLRGELPERAPTPEQSIPVTFWSAGSHGGRAWARSVDVPTWKAIERNYPLAVRAELGRRPATGFLPGIGGRLVL